MKWDLDLKNFCIFIFIVPYIKTHAPQKNAYDKTSEGKTSTNMTKTFSMWLYKYLLKIFKDKFERFWNRTMDVWRESALMHLALKMEGQGS